MKYKVELWVAGTKFNFYCYAASPSGANQVALSQHPNATIIHTTMVFKWFTPLRCPYKGDENYGWYDCTPRNDLNVVMPANLAMLREANKFGLQRPTTV